MSESDLGRWIARLRDPDPGAATSSTDGIDADVVDSAWRFAAEHSRRYVATGGEDDGWDGPRPILLLYTTGRRSGQTRRAPVVYFDHDGHRYVVASKGGADSHPMWYENLVADPRVHVRVGADVYDATAVVVAPDERARVWPALVAGYPMMAEYQATTDRQIPLVRLDPA